MKIPQLIRLLNIKFLLLFLMISFFVSAQNKEWNTIYKFTTEQGISSNVVYAVLQDKKGFIWMATEEGLNKFDGRNFTFFTSGPGRYSLTHNRTQTLLLAPDGNIWTGTSDGLNIYDYRADSVIQVRKNTPGYNLEYNDITFLCHGKNPDITWVGTYGNGISYYDWSKKKFGTLKLPATRNSEPPMFVMSLMEDDNNRLWIGTRHNGLYKFDLQSRRLEYFKLPEMGVFIRTIFQDSFRRIWIGSSNGCYIYNETTNKLELVKYPAELLNNSIGSITEDNHGKIWVGTETNVLNFSVRSFSMNQTFGYQTIQYGVSSNKLNCPSVNTIIADKDNNVWIGTAWGGMNMLRGIPAKFRLYKNESETKTSVPNSPVTALHADKNNIYLATLGTDKTSLGVINTQNGIFTALPADKKLSGFIYHTIHLDHQQNIWLGTYNKGVIKIDKGSGNIRHFYHQPGNRQTLPDNDIRCMLETRDKTLWIGTSNGLAKYIDRLTVISTVPIFKKRIGVRCIQEDNEGRLWIGTYGEGIVSYHPAKAQINMNPLSLDLGVITDIVTHNDSIWIGTRSNGLVLFNKKTKQKKVFSSENGFNSDYVKSIIRDKNGKIWVTTSRGISNLNPKTGEVENYSTQDGVQSADFNERSKTITSDGKIAFGGFGGINIFVPGNVQRNDQCPEVVFTKLQVFNDVIYPTVDRNGNDELKENITHAGKIVLKHNQSVFTIEFAGINYYAPQKIKYAYFLEGSDKKWNDLGNQNSVTFRNLSPGTYLFKVKASSPDAVWSDDNIASIKIVIHPPFWKSVWAYMLYLILLGVIIYFVWQYINIKISANNAIKIERARREKDEELLQEKLQFFTNISHEFRTPLTLIMGPIEKMQQEAASDDIKMHLQLILRNAKRLLNMVNQLLDFRKAERGLMKLRIQQADIIQVCKEIFISFEELRKDHHVNFEFIHSKDMLMAWFDVEFLNKSLYNLLSNAYKFTPPDGHIKVILEEKMNESEVRTVEIRVVDDGKGIKGEDLPFVFDRFYQGKEQGLSQKGSGIGLHLTHSLIELHHGTIQVSSDPRQETIFTITLPIQKSAYHPDEFLIDSDPSNSGSDSDQIQTVENEQVKEQTSSSTFQKRILIVEDNADIRLYIRNILGHDYVLEEAENGIEGLEMAGKHDYDLIITDLMMPEMDGMEMCRQLKDNIETSHIPIIILTAKSQIDSRIEGLTIGAESFITKPFHPKHLSIRVSKLIELRELLREKYSRKISFGEISQSAETPVSPDEIFMQKVIRVILDKMIDSEFNGDALASEMGISRMGLHRKIKAMTGQSTGEFIRNLRLKKSAELLMLPGKNISEVCYDVGFNSPSYFTTCFTEVYKMTPSEYMKNKK